MILRSQFNIVTHELFNITACVLCINQMKANIHRELLSQDCFVSCFQLDTIKHMCTFALKVHNCIHVQMYVSVYFLFARKAWQHVFTGWMCLVHTNVDANFLMCLLSASCISHVNFFYEIDSLFWHRLLLLLVDRGHCRKTVEGSTALQSLTSRGRPFQSGQAKVHFCGCIKLFLDFWQMSMLVFYLQCKHSIFY